MIIFQQRKKTLKESSWEAIETPPPSQVKVKPDPEIHLFLNTTLLLTTSRPNPSTFSEMEEFLPGQE